MRRDHWSRTAEFVAAFRGLAPLLPPEARLVEDRFGVDFSSPLFRGFYKTLLGAPILATPFRAGRGFLLYMQVRTRVLDDYVRAFLDGGGDQIVILGAGFDCRAARIGGARYFEIDHPATQARKRQVLAGAGAADLPVEYVAWDFERDPLAGLPARLRESGHDPSRPTLTLWEGVTMYLTEETISSSVTAVRDFSAPGSQLAFTYFTRAALERPSVSNRLLGRLVKRLGEPYTFGFDPATLSDFLAARGFTLGEDRSAHSWAHTLMPPELVASVNRAPSRIALAERSA